MGDVILNPRGPVSGTLPKFQFHANYRLPARSLLNFIDNAVRIFYAMVFLKAVVYTRL